MTAVNADMIRELRRCANISQENLAEIGLIRVDYSQNFETGLLPEIPETILARLADHLRVPLDWLVKK